MRLVVLVCLVACSSNNKDTLPTPGGTVDSGMKMDAAFRDARPADAPADGSAAAIDAALIRGRVCLVTNDPRNLGLDPANDCATTGADGLTVRLANATTTTSADGTFTIVSDGVMNTSVWGVTGPNIVSSYKVFSDYLIPALTTSLYDSMKTANKVILLPGQGSVIAQVVQNGVGASGKAAFSSPTSEYDPFYDAGSATTFGQTTTSTAGFVWAAGIDVGTATLTVGTPPSPLQNTITTAQLPIVDGAITFVTVTFF